MQQIKLFKGIEHNLADLEDEINRWLVESQAEVLQIAGNIAPQSASPKAGASGLTQGDFPPSDILVIVLYKRPPGTK
ncbi:MAG TPA: hypothetical protein VNH11_10725 [Pirellulales bacterium]|nr:hypothetical protein [Pirellulales bacterium]